MFLKFTLSPYTMLQTPNIAWRKLCSLFLNIFKLGKRGKGGHKIVQIAVFPQFLTLIVVKIKIFFSNKLVNWKNRAELLLPPVRKFSNIDGDFAWEKAE